MNKILIIFSVLVAVCYGQSVFLREVGVPMGSINQLGDWIQQIERSQFLDCPTNENRFGLTCDPAAVSRDDLDNYFCGSQPNEFGWCGAYWAAMHAAPGSDEDLNSVPGSNKRGVSNGALPINTNVGGDAYDRYQMYLEMFGRVCSCHCGCSSGCTGLGNSEAEQLFCGAPAGPAGPAVGPAIPFPLLDGVGLTGNSIMTVFLNEIILDDAPIEVFRESTPEGLDVETGLSDEEKTKRGLFGHPQLQPGEVVNLNPGERKIYVYGPLRLDFVSCEKALVSEKEKRREFCYLYGTLTVNNGETFFNELENPEEDTCSDPHTAFVEVPCSLVIPK